MSDDTLQEAYDALKPALEVFSTKGDARLLELIEEHDLSLAVPLQRRVKTFSSVAEKLAHRGGASADLSQLDDLVGFRLIVGYERDIEPACQVVEYAFRIERREAPAARLRPDQFGYASAVHLIVAPPNEWRSDGHRPISLPLRGEVQIRTLAQHLWAHASHHLQYKSEPAVPAELRRSVHRTAALLELVDLELERVLTERSEFDQRAQTLEELEEIDVSSAAAVLDALWPEEHKHDSEKYGVLAQNLLKRGIDTPAELARIIRRHRETVLDYARRYAQRKLTNIDRHGLDSERLTIERPNRHSTAHNISEGMVARLRQGVFFSHVALTFAALDVEQEGRDLLGELVD